jgi:hypothetical protein
MSRQSTKRTDAAVVMPILIPVLGEELAAAVIELRDDIKGVPITEYAAKLLVKEYNKTGNPRAAAEMQIANSWRGFFASWYEGALRKDQRNQPKRSNDMANFTGEMMEMARERALQTSRH